MVDNQQENTRKVAMITGASSGIGKATALELARLGYSVAIGARRTEALLEVKAEIEALGGEVFLQALDVTDVASATAFVEQTMHHYGQIDVLVNNAGLAKGMSKVAEQQAEDDWQQMIETNVMGLLRMTRLVLPLMVKRNSGHIVNLGSTAGHEAYAGAAVYSATKFGVRAISAALRQELLGHAVRVTLIDPGMVETEFSLVRFSGDEERAANVYARTTPLTAQDIADVIGFAVTRKAHVNLDDIILRPVDQASWGLVHRHS